MEHIEQIKEICQQLPPHPQQQQQQLQALREDQHQQQQQQLHTTTATTTKSDDSASSSPSSTADTQQKQQDNSGDIKAISPTQQQDKDQACSYTSMIAQSIMRSHYKRATLSEIYNYMSNTFEVLKKRGNGWRNCVRHTLSLNECFVKLNRPENGRSCNWTVHPSYFDAFMRGDYRKRRSNRKKSHRTSPHQLQHWSSAMSGALDHHHHHQQRYTSPYNSSHHGHQQPTPITMNGFPPHPPPPPPSSYHHYHYQGLPPPPPHHQQQTESHHHHQVSPPLNHHHSNHYVTSQQQQSTSSTPAATSSVWQNYMSSLENHPKGFATPPPPSAQHHADFNNANSTSYDYQQSPPVAHKHFVTPPTPPQATSAGTHFPPPPPPTAASSSSVINHHSSESPSSTDGNHLSPNASFDSPAVNTERLRHMNNATNRNTSLGGFSSSTSSPYLPIKLERNAPHENYSCGSSERVVYERALSCEAVPPIHHFQAENNLATCYGNLSNRSYRAEYF